MARRKRRSLAGLKSIHSKSDMEVGKRLLRHARSSVTEGYCGHALNYLIEAARHIGMAQGHEWEASGRSTVKGQRDVRDTLRSTAKRVLACAKVSKNY